MPPFVLVHGAWHGAWCWRRVAPLLRAAGHEVFAVTLTGLGDRAHLLSAEVTLETHIADVMATLEAEELGDAVLAVHSYAGMLGTAVADRMPGRLRHLVYVDAVVPAPGECWSSTQDAATQQARRAAIAASPLGALPATDPVSFGLNADDHAWVARRQSAHPGGTYDAPLAFDAARVGALPRTFVDCTDPALATIAATRRRIADPGFWDGHWLPNARRHAIATGHDPMVSAPRELADVLLAAAR